jgi:hypothetical protein
MIISQRPPKFFENSLGLRQLGTKPDLFDQGTIPTVETQLQLPVYQIYGVSVITHTHTLLWARFVDNHLSTMEVIFKN